MLPINFYLISTKITPTIRKCSAFFFINKNIVNRHAKYLLSILYCSRTIFSILCAILAWENCTCVSCVPESISDTLQILFQALYYSIYMGKQSRYSVKKGNNDTDIFRVGFFFLNERFRTSPIVQFSQFLTYGAVMLSCPSYTLRNVTQHKHKHGSFQYNTRVRRWHL